ncbi:MAG TPA: hypothetical protein VEI50_15510 [Nitrospiraceae bacterium]|nr:hypothetical protein [Nitrospiraceae bacterium]
MALSCLNDLRATNGWRTFLVVAVTIRDYEVTEQSSREYGALAYLQNPVEPDKLIATIRGVLEKKE